MTSVQKRYVTNTGRDPKCLEMGMMQNRPVTDAGPERPFRCLDDQWPMTIPQLTGRELLRLMCRVRGVAPQVLHHHLHDRGEAMMTMKTSKTTTIKTKTRKIRNMSMVKIMTMMHDRRLKLRWKGGLLSWEYRSYVVEITLFLGKYIPPVIHYRYDDCVF